MIDIKEINNAINALPIGYKTKQLDEVIKSFMNRKEKVSYDESLLTHNDHLQRAFFFINAKQIKNEDDKLAFIDQYKHLFYYWYCTDQIICLVNKCQFETMYQYASSYVVSTQTYDRRWGYVMFIFHPCKKDLKCAQKIVQLLMDDSEETNQMAQAWLLCELAIFHPDFIYDYLSNKHLGYKITSKAISKICDSFRIDNETKKKFKEIRKTFYETQEIR